MLAYMMSSCYFAAVSRWQHNNMDIDSLYEGARRGDRQAEERLFEALSESFRIYVRLRIQNEHDAQEVVQDVLLTIAQKYKEVQFVKSFAAWAYKIFEHKLFTYYRSKRTRRNKFVEMEDCDQTGFSYNPDPDLKRQLLKCLEEVGRANNRYAAILDLHIQGFNGDEISEKLGVTKNSIFVSLSRARAKLKICLEKGDTR